MDGPVPGCGGGAAFRQRGRTTEREAGKKEEPRVGPSCKRERGRENGAAGPVGCPSGPRLGRIRHGRAIRVSFLI
jgi:hypothetical protein